MPNFQLCVKSHACTFSHLPWSHAINTQPTNYSREIRLTLHVGYCSLLRILDLFPEHTLILCHPASLHCHIVTHTTVVTHVHTVTADSSPHSCTPPNSSGNLPLLSFVNWNVSGTDQDVLTLPLRPMQGDTQVLLDIRRHCCVYRGLYVCTRQNSLTNH